MLMIEDSAPESQSVILSKPERRIGSSYGVDDKALGQSDEPVLPRSVAGYGFLAAPPDCVRRPLLVGRRGGSARNDNGATVPSSVILNEPERLDRAPALTDASRSGEVKNPYPVPRVSKARIPRAVALRVTGRREGETSLRLSLVA